MSAGRDVVQGRKRAVGVAKHVNTHVRMAERSKAPDSRVELFLTGVFWSTNVGVGSNPTSDKRFRQVLKIHKIAKY